MTVIDLRSDTVTHPTAEMRQAMAAAEVGDDVYGEDPTVNRLQEMAAAVTGKERALFMPSGTMANLIAVKAHTEPGEEAIVERRGHLLQYEMGGMAWLSGVMPKVLDGERGILCPEMVARHASRDVPYYQARTGVICLENTHNAAGGSVYPLETLARIAGVAANAGVPVHLDGARLFNAAVALKTPAATICGHVDSVMFSVSKALSAPVGSVLCGSGEFIERARRIRRVVGGGMRQAGVLAAAAIVALETMVERLDEDHQNARLLAAGLSQVPCVQIDPLTVETNIVIFTLADGTLSAREWVERARARGVLCSQMDAGTVRLVTHRHIGDSHVEDALAVFRTIAG